MIKQPHPGLLAFMRVVEESFERGTAQPETNSKNSGKKTAPKKPALKELMEEQTHRRIQNGVNFSRDLFLLNQGQLDTLREAPLSKAAMALLEDLNGLGMPMPADGRYETADMLKTLRTVPASPAGWTQWWLTQRTSHIGVHRTRKEDNREFPILADAVRTLGLTALAHIPAYSTVAEEFTAKKAETIPEVKLTSVYGGARQILALGERLLLSNEELTTTPDGHVKRGDSPERVAHYLKEASLNVE